MKKPFFTVRKSQLDFDKTVSAIRKAAPEHGWKVLSAHDLQETGLEAGYQDMAKVRVITIYDPHEGYALLHDDDNKLLSALLPQHFTVYETTDGQVYVAGINLGRFSKMFRGSVREGLKASSERRTQALRGIVEQAESENPRRMVAIIAAIIGMLALAGAVVVIIIRNRSEPDADASPSDMTLRLDENPR